jgi:hypothetical protein
MYVGHVSLQVVNETPVRPLSRKRRIKNKRRLNWGNVSDAARKLTVNVFSVKGSSVKTTFGACRLMSPVEWIWNTI